MVAQVNGNGGALVKPGEALAVREDEALVMHCSPNEALRRIQELQAFVANVMVPGTDYGVIPGAGDKPALFQPGAQKLCEIYGLTPDFEDLSVSEDWDRPFFMYRKRCRLSLRRNGAFVGAGIGSCNSREDRYAWRWIDGKNLPAGVEKDTLKSKVTKWGTKYRMPNEDIFSLVNTIEKMACKRALIHAVLGVTRSSNLFTQDVEDLPPEVFGEASNKRSWAQAQIVAPAAIKDADIVITPSPLETHEQTEDEQFAHYAKQLQGATTTKELRAIGSAFPESMPQALRAKLHVVYIARQQDLLQQSKAAPKPPTTPEAA